MNDTVQWSSYTFNIHQYNANWSDLPGIYIFAKTTPRSQWQALYVGQASRFSERIPGHELWDKAQSLGATHVHAMAVPQADMRDKIERELIQMYQPILNIQLR